MRFILKCHCFRVQNNEITLLICSPPYYISRPKLVRGLFRNAGMKYVQIGVIFFAQVRCLMSITNESLFLWRINDLQTGETINEFGAVEL